MRKGGRSQPHVSKASLSTGWENQSIQYRCQGLKIRTEIAKNCSNNTPFYWAFTRSHHSKTVGLLLTFCVEFAHSLCVDVSSPKTCASGKPATLNCACVCECGCCCWLLMMMMMMFISVLALVGC